jgi:hypothetical protein
MIVLKRLFCWIFNHSRPEERLADGVGGKNRYFIYRCQHCGKRWWEIVIWKADEQKVTEG